MQAPTITRHDDACTARHQQRDAYAARWPNYCRTCEGHGETSYEDDPSAAGVSLSPGSMTFTDPCRCVEEGICPRCGGGMLSMRHRLARWVDGAVWWPVIRWNQQRTRQRWVYDFVTWLAHTVAGATRWDDHNPCVQCGWDGGRNDGEAMPSDECLCGWADDFAEFSSC